MADDQFGFTLAIQGNVLVAGARRADLPGAMDAGAVYVFAIHYDSLDFPAKLTASDARGGDQFGQSIAFDGPVIAVGANRADIAGNGNQGAVYLFRRIANDG